MPKHDEKRLATLLIKHVILHGMNALAISAYRQQAGTLEGTGPVLNILGQIHYHRAGCEAAHITTGFEAAG